MHKFLTYDTYIAKVVWEHIDTWAQRYYNFVGIFSVLKSSNDLVMHAIIVSDNCDKLICLQ